MSCISISFPTRLAHNFSNNMQSEAFDLTCVANLKFELNVTCSYRRSLDVFTLSSLYSNVNSFTISYFISSYHIC